MYDNWYQEPKEGNIDLDIKYYQSHSGRKSLLLVAAVVNTYKNCNSIIDVGCRSAGLLSRIGDDYKHRIATDIYPPKFLGFSLEQGKFTHGDFLNLSFDKMDVVVCLETLEHIRPDLRIAFANKLYDLAIKHLIVSIPYKWKNSTEPVPHNDLDEVDLLSWFYPYVPDREEFCQGHYITFFDKEK